MLELLEMYENAVNNHEYPCPTSQIKKVKGEREMGMKNGREEWVRSIGGWRIDESERE